MKLLKEIIIWLFEKYAYDYWVDKSVREQDEKEMKKYGVNTIEELRDIQLDEQQEPFKEAYEQGKYDLLAKQEDKKECTCTKWTTYAGCPIHGIDGNKSRFIKNTSTLSPLDSIEDVENIVLVCSSCHGKIHLDSKRALEMRNKQINN